MKAPASLNEPEHNPEGSSESLADYRPDRDDFSRLLYLVSREIRAQKEARQKGAA